MAIDRLQQKRQEVGKGVKMLGSKCMVKILGKMFWLTIKTNVSYNDDTGMIISSDECDRNGGKYI